MIAAKNIHYPQLFSPGKIGNLALRNRIVMAAMGSEFANDDGSIGERLMDYYEARAAGGVGLDCIGNLIGFLAQRRGDAEYDWLFFRCLFACINRAN